MYTGLRYIRREQYMRQKKLILTNKHEKQTMEVIYETNTYIHRKRSVSEYNTVSYTVLTTTNSTFKHIFAHHNAQHSMLRQHIYFFGIR